MEQGLVTLSGSSETSTDLVTPLHLPRWCICSSLFVVRLERRFDGSLGSSLTLYLIGTPNTPFVLRAFWEGERKVTKSLTWKTQEDLGRWSGVLGRPQGGPIRQKRNRDLGDSRKGGKGSTETQWQDTTGGGWRRRFFGRHHWSRSSLCLGLGTCIHWKVSSLKITTIKSVLDVPQRFHH